MEVDFLIQFLNNKNAKIIKKTSLISLDKLALKNQQIIIHKLNQPLMIYDSQKHKKSLLFIPVVNRTTMMIL